MKEKLYIYSRVSSSIQEEGSSIRTQQEIGIELAKKLDMDYEIHNEGGMSSSKDTLDNRPVILNLLRLMDEKIVKNLYVWNTDRLSRNQITWYTIRQKMVKNNVVLYTSNGKHTTTDFMENMILGILSEVSQYDNKVRTERSRLGKIEVVKLNYWRGGDTPFGYKLESDGKGNKLVENKKESKWIQYIYAEYSMGKALKDIKSHLERNQIKTRRENEKWSMGSLQVILKNQTYLGFDHFTDKKTNLTIKNSIPQLISNKLWNEVQERRKLMLLRKGQLNKTKKFYLFRDFLFCSCGTPMGGRIKLDKHIQHYYCPLSERRFNNSYKKDETCDMKRCLNIQTTDKIVWNKIVDVLGDTIKLKEILKEKTIIGKSMSSREVKKIIKEKDEKIIELTKTKNKLEKGLVTIETENILNKYPSIEVYKALKRDVTKKYNQTLSEIEDVKNSLKQIGNDELWFDWIDKFSDEMNANRKLSELMKKELLKLIIDKIMVEYDPIEKTHILTINFKIPVFIEEGNEVSLKPSRVVITPTKSGRKPKNQIEPVENYSTVTDFARFLG
jgi:DNA invertase Pin-like site-specific DNA recombinase